MLHHSEWPYNDEQLIEIGRGYQRKMIQRWFHVLGLGTLDQHAAVPEIMFYGWRRALNSNPELKLKILENEGSEGCPGGRIHLIRDATSRDLPPDKDAFLVLAAYVYPEDEDSATLPMQLAWSHVGYALDEKTCMPGGRVKLSWTPTNPGLSSAPPKR